MKQANFNDIYPSSKKKVADNIFSNTDPDIDINLKTIKDSLSPEFKDPNQIDMKTRMQ